MSNRIFIVGIGPGAKDNLTKEAKGIITDADLLLGAKSVTDAIQTDKRIINEYLPDKVAEAIKNETDKTIAVLMRGDVGFFSGAKKLTAALPDAKLIPGIASPVLFAARLKTSWDDAVLLSLHGKDENPILKITRNKKCFILTGGKHTPKDLIDELIKYNLTDIKVSVGENLSYENERITTGTPKELEGKEFDSLSVVFTQNDNAEKATRTGIPDDEFIRGDVPMTKSEIRAISLSKLNLKSDSIIWDVGAGTGSVSIECALAAEDGKVYAIEKKPEAIELIDQNKINFRTDNLEIIEGAAPEALNDLPAPTHVFIGGSSGNLREIVDTVLEKNNDATIVINAITLETQNEASALAGKFEKFEVVSASISRSREAGNYHLMNSLNPVWIFTMCGGR